MSGAFDFLAQQARARRASAILVFLFVVLTAAIALAIGVLVGIAFGGERMMSGAPIAGAPGLELDLGAAAAATGLVMAIVIGAALIRVVSFGGDGSRVAKALGAEEVTADTQNPYKRRYINVVDEMAIAAGLPRPRAFVVKHEQGINAFAAGNSPERAAVGVTHGALAKLNRQELAGVVAHEMAHIANYDTRLNMRLMGMVFGLVALYALGRGMLRSFIFMRAGRRNRGAAPVMAMGLALLVLGSLGMLAGRVLQSAVSRRREYLADATGVQFTRNPEGLANALKKIGAGQAGSAVANAHAEEARHMFFAAATSSLGGMFATHPPLIDRIRALEPQFDPKTDRVWGMDDRAFLRESRQELSLGPWEWQGMGEGDRATR